MYKNISIQFIEELILFKFMLIIINNILVLNIVS